MYEKLTSVFRSNLRVDHLPGNMQPTPPNPSHSNAPGTSAQSQREKSARAPTQQHSILPSTLPSSRLPPTAENRTRTALQASVIQQRPLTTQTPPTSRLPRVDQIPSDAQAARRPAMRASSIAQSPLSAGRLTPPRFFSGPQLDSHPPTFSSSRPPMNSKPTSSSRPSSATYVDAVRLPTPIMHVRNQVPPAPTRRGHGPYQAPASSQRVVVIDAEGDLYLEVGQTSFKVSRAAVRLASPVLKAMLSFGGAEDADCLVLPAIMQDFNPCPAVDAVQTMLLLCHWQFDSLPASLTLSELRYLSRACAQYSCTAVAVQHVRAWVQSYLDVSVTKGYQMLSLIWIGWIFKWKDVFLRGTSLLTESKCPAEFRTLPVDFVPPGVKGKYSSLAFTTSK